MVGWRPEGSSSTCLFASYLRVLTEWPPPSRPDPGHCARRQNKIQTRSEAKPCCDRWLTGTTSVFSLHFGGFVDQYLALYGYLNVWWCLRIGCLCLLIGLVGHREGPESIVGNVKTKALVVVICVGSQLLCIAFLFQCSERNACSSLNLPVGPKAISYGTYCSLSIYV